MAKYAPTANKIGYANTVSLNPASIAAATTGAVQTFAAATYPKLTGLKAGQLTFVQFHLTPVSAFVFILGAACYTNGTLTIWFANNDPSNAVDLAAADFDIWQP